VGTAVVRSFKVVGNALHKAGPYLLIELVLPGGTFFALFLFLYQRRQPLDAVGVATASAAIARAGTMLRDQIAFVVEPLDIASLWRGRHRERDGLEALAMAPAL
jgi:hypothetical protein